MKSVVYLCCPVQSQEGWTHLTALTTFLKGDWDENSERRLLPARQLDFRDPGTARIFDETHNLGDWVVNYDELLDRRQLLNQEVRVIRYKQSSTQGRNVVVSSKASLGLLRSMVLSRLEELLLGLSKQECTALADRFIQEANDVSGDIVLRAAKRGRNASELMGVVLSRYLLRRELGETRYFGWYFLDDYADWLGQRRSGSPTSWHSARSRSLTGSFAWRSWSRRRNSLNRRTSPRSAGVAEAAPRHPQADRRGSFRGPRAARPRPLARAALGPDP